MDNKKVEISEYCKDCCFLCKTDKEYCPNKKSKYDMRKQYQQLQNIKILKSIHNELMDEINKK